MEGEMGTGARIAIALIVLGVLISVVFTILGFTRSTTNQGITTVQNSLESMQLAVFDDYDQQIHSGTQVLSALKLFEGRPIGILVVTKSSDPNGYNYGAQFEGVNATSRLLSPVPDKEDDDSFYTIDLKVSNGTLSYNMDYLKTKTTGDDQFIRPTAKFIAELIKDETGTIVGICFKQQ
jgi:hypothetical protein